MAVIHRALFTWVMLALFLVLLVLRLDERVRWSWFIVFSTVWLHDAIVLMSLVVKVVTACKESPESTRRQAARCLYCLLACALKLIFQVLLCLKLDGGGLTLRTILMPMWVFLPLAVVDLAGELKRGTRA